MVEMLGVLAIIGVLGVAGIAGYTTALNKHKANKILNDTSLRAVVASTQIQRGVGNPTLSEFINNDLGCGIFDTTVYTKGNLASMPKEQFGIKVSGVSKEICQEILNTIGDKTVMRRISDASALTTPLTTCNDTNSFFIIYNNDLSAKPVATDFSDISACKEAGFIWNNGQCSSDMCETCSTKQTCLTVAGEKKCVSECPSGETRDEETGTCTDSKCTDYTNCEEGYFCNFSAPCASLGTCKKNSSISAKTGVLTVSGVEYTAVCSVAGSSNLGSFYKAEDWCLAMGGRLPTSKEVCDRTENSIGSCLADNSAERLRGQIRSLCNAAIGSDWMWAIYPDNNRTSCYMFSFRLDATGNSAGTYEYGNKSDRRALCLLPK